MNIDTAKEWIKASSLDFRNIKYIIEDEHLTPVVAFHSQQAIEKLFKACLEFIEAKYPKQHDLVNLYKMLTKNNVHLNVDNILLKKINELYTGVRYLGDLRFLPNGKTSIEEAKEFYNFALNIYEKVKNLLQGQSSMFSFLDKDELWESRI